MNTIWKRSVLSCKKAAEKAKKNAENKKRGYKDGSGVKRVELGGGLRKER